MTKAEIVRLSFLISFLLFLTGTVAVPYASSAAIDFLDWLGVSSGEKREFMAPQIENFLYFVGRTLLILTVVRSQSLWRDAE